MRRPIYLVIALVLALTILPAAGHAANDRPETAILLTAENPSHSDRLVGDTGGAVRFYRVQYAGNGQAILVQLTASRDHGATGPAFGFKIYSPNGLLGQASVDKGDNSFTHYSMTMAGSTAGDYFIQVYNFTDRLDVDFTIQASGLAAATTSAGGAPVPVNNTTASAAMPVAQPSALIGGALSVDNDCRHQFFTASYPGGHLPFNVEMVYNPPSPTQNNAINLLVWNSSGEVVARGGESRRDSTDVTIGATFGGTDAGDNLLVQVSNCQPGFSMSFSLSFQGTAGTLTPVSDNTTPDRAFVLSPTSTAAQGVMPAGPEGTYNFYLVRYQGGNKDVTIGITLDEQNSFTDGAIGYNLFNGSDLTVQVRSHLGQKGNKRIAYYTINQQDAVTFGLQVFNWTRGMPVQYNIYAIGLDK